jgi:hypothetical protein
MSVVNSIIFFLFLCLLGVAAFVVLKPMVVRMGVEKALSSPTYASLVSSQLITLSKAAQQDITINYRFSSEKNILYSIDAKERGVTVCGQTKTCTCVNTTSIPPHTVEIEALASDECKDVCSELNLEYQPSTTELSSLCVKSPLLFDVLFSYDSIVGLHIRKTELSTGSSILIEPLAGG